MNSSVNSKLPVIVITYNRPNSLARLFESLVRSDATSEAKILVSIEGGAPNDVYQTAMKFKEILGLEIICHPKRQGLREHVLWCGDMLASMGGGVLLEDDLAVAPGFCSFAKNAAAFYRDQNNIASISLYSHRRNIYTYGIFEPDLDEFDTYFLQLPASWGQYWYKEKWNAFRGWLKSNSKIDQDDRLLPHKLRNWSDNSWLKHFTNYCIKNEMQNVYPRSSFTTNFAEVGTHMTQLSTVFQVPLAKRQLDRFATSTKEGVVYDSFFERESSAFSSWLPVDSNDIVVDLYGQKEYNAGKKWWLTRKNSRKTEKQFANLMRPQEQNIACGCDGYFFNLSRENNIEPEPTDNASLDIIEGFGGEIPGKAAMLFLKLALSRRVSRLIGG